MMAIAEEVQSILVGPLEHASIFLASGPRIFDTPGRPVRVPLLTDSEDPDWIGESEQITEKDATFDELTLLPETMKSVKVITRFSNELARQSVIALDAALRDRLVRDVAAKLDFAFFAGDGGTPAGSEPHRGALAMPSAGRAPSRSDGLVLTIRAARSEQVYRWLVRGVTQGSLR
jgi:HK97 family phage major capsid protein